MAGNYPFHGKLHRSTHHTNPTPGILESGTDPVAGPSSKFQGIFFTQNEGSSSDWYSAYTTLNANSAYWVSVYTTVYANSSKWESTCCCRVFARKFDRPADPFHFQDDTNR